MSLKSMKIRLGTMAAGFVLLVLVLLVGVPTLNSDRTLVLIDFGIYPDAFDGLDVYIDGKPIGKLQRIGGIAKTGFQVKEGDHVITIAHDKWKCVPERFTAGSEGRTIVYMLGIRTRVNLEGNSEVRIVLSM